MKKTPKCPFLSNLRKKINCKQFGHTISSNFLHRHAFFMGNKSKNREYDKAGKYTGPTVDAGHNDGVSVAVVVELVVTGHGYHSSCTGTQGVENLSGSIRPYLPVKTE